MKEMSEYDHHISREGKPYQPMHRAMYKTIVELLRNRPASILEVGFGIGYGLDLLLKANCIDKYLGIENDEKSFKYVADKMLGNEKIDLLFDNWINVNIPEKYNIFDFTLCIEVIEHLPFSQLIRFLKKLQKYTRRTLFLSTQDKDIGSHGIYTKKEVITALEHSGFKKILDIEWQLPHTLFICKP